MWEPRCTPTYTAWGSRFRIVRFLYFVQPQVCECVCVWVGICGLIKSFLKGGMSFGVEVMVAFSSRKDDDRGKILWIIKGSQIKRDLP